MYINESCRKIILTSWWTDKTRQVLFKNGRWTGVAARNLRSKDWGGMAQEREDWSRLLWEARTNKGLQCRWYILEYHYTYTHCRMIMHMRFKVICKLAKNLHNVEKWWNVKSDAYSTYLPFLREKTVRLVEIKIKLHSHKYITNIRQ